METNFREELFLQAKKWVLEAGETIRSKINDPLEVHTKSNPNDLVTAMDQSTESYFGKNMKNDFTNHKRLCEEGYRDELKSLNRFVLISDTMDGTMNLDDQKRNFAMSIGI